MVRGASPGSGLVFGVQAWSVSSRQTINGTINGGSFERISATYGDVVETGFSKHDSTKQLLRDGVAIVQHLEDTCNEQWQHQSTRVNN